MIDNSFQDALSSISFEIEEIENEYNLDDATDDDLHPIDVFKSPGDAKHHTDSRVTPG